MNLRDLNTDQLEAEIARRDEATATAQFAWHKAREATKAARRAETPLRNQFYEKLEAEREAKGERNRREDILRNVGQT